MKTVATTNQFFQFMIGFFTFIILCDIYYRIRRRLKKAEVKPKAPIFKAKEEPTDRQWHSNAWMLRSRACNHAAKRRESRRMRRFNLKNGF